MTPVDIEALVRDIADGIRVFRTRDGKPLTDAECEERARNCAVRVIARFELRRLPEVSSAVDWNDPRISRWEPGQYRRAFASREELAALYADGKPRGHLATCRCDKCDTVDRSVKS